MTEPIAAKTEPTPRVTNHVELALDFLRAATGADRVSLSLWRSNGTTDLWSLDDSGHAYRLMPNVSTQLLQHFNENPRAERRRNLAESLFASDHTLARRGFGEVIRAPLVNSSGQAYGILNVIRVEPSRLEHDLHFAERFASALPFVVAEDQAGDGLG